MASVAARLVALAEALDPYRAQGCILEPPAIETISRVLRDCAADAGRRGGAVVLPHLGVIGEPAAAAQGGA